MTMQEDGLPQTHKVDIVSGRVDTAEDRIALARRLEGVYGNMNREALEKGLVVISSLQTANSYVLEGTPYTSYTVTFQIVRRDALEREQRRAMLTGVPPGGGRGAGFN